MSETQRPPSQFDELDQDPTIVDGRAFDEQHAPDNESPKTQSRKQQFSEAMGHVALVRSGVTMENATHESKAGAINATPYNQEIQPESIREKIVAARLQKKLDKHTRLVDPKLASKDLPKPFRVQRTKESELQAYKRNNGKADLRLKPRATIKAIKKLEKEARMDKLKGKKISDDELAQKRKNAVVYRSGTLVPFNRAAVPVATKRREKQARKLERYGNKRVSNTEDTTTQKSERRRSKKELEHNPETYFDPATILELKRELKREADKLEVDAIVKSLSSSDPSDIKRDQIEASVLDKLLAKHFGLSSYRKVRKVVPQWLELTVRDMLQQSEEQLESMVNGRTSSDTTIDTPQIIQKPSTVQKPKSRYSFEPIEEEEPENSEVALGHDETFDNPIENPIYEITELEDVLDNMEQLNPEDPMYDATIEKLMRSIDKISTETIYSGGTTIPGTDEVVGQTAKTSYKYEETDESGIIRKIPLETDVAKKLLDFKAEGLKNMKSEE